MASDLDTSYRTWKLADLVALRLSTLLIIENIQGTGQSHSLNGRGTTQADFEKATKTLANVNAAIDYKSNPANAGNNGYASRYASFNRYG